MKPVGFVDPRSGRRPYALLQLRREDTRGQMFNLVGCQTKLTYSAQEKVFRLIPALRQARFARLGSIHRNTFINAPKVLEPDLSLKGHPRLMIAGQLAGVEGYVESAACGLWAGLNAARRHNGLPPLLFPPTTALGGLAFHLQNQATDNFQPGNITWGLLPPLPPPPPPARKWAKKDKNQALGQRARRDLLAWMKEQKLEIFPGESVFFS
jgi:methylenetetrahydrofolate--tRNA-(uracil-5-)-methyltransferase